MPEPKSAKNRQHSDLRATEDHCSEVQQLPMLGARVPAENETLVVMAEPEGRAVPPLPRAWVR